MTHVKKLIFNLLMCNVKYTYNINNNHINNNHINNDKISAKY